MKREKKLTKQQRINGLAWDIVDIVFGLTASEDLEEALRAVIEELENRNKKQ